MSILYLSSKAYLKLKYYTLEVDGEVIGFLVIDDSNSLLVEDVVLPKQEISDTSCDFNSLQFDILLSNNNIDISKIKGWFHSHNTMESSFSHTDDDTIEKLGRRLPYVVSIVTSKHNHFDMIAKIDIFKPIRFEEELEIRTIIEDNEELLNLVRDEIKQRVTQKTFILYRPSYNATCPFPNGKCKYTLYQFCPYVNSKCPKVNYRKHWGYEELW